MQLLFILHTEVYHDGTLRILLMREDIPVAKRLIASQMYNTGKEYMPGPKYISGKNIGFTTHYDIDVGFGVGIALNY